MGDSFPIFFLGGTGEAGQTSILLVTWDLWSKCLLLFFVFCLFRWFLLTNAGQTSIWLVTCDLWFQYNAN